jgi:hypothetical protein
MKTLKNKLLIAVILISGITGLNNCKSVVEKETITNIVSSEEYLQLSDIEKQIADKINASINGLKGLSVNKKNYTKYLAYFFVDTINDTSDFFDFEVVLLDKEKEKKDMLRANSCTISGYGSGVKCIKKISSHIKDNGLKDLDVQVHINQDGDYIIAW